MLNYPLKLSFKVFTFAPQVKVTDATGQTVLYVRRKIMTMKDDVKIYADEAQQEQLYQINADRMIDFSANFRINTTDGRTLGTLRRKGLRSIWRATYPIADANGQDAGLIHEENPWVKVIDGLAEEIPVVGWLVVLLLNPKYLVELNGRPVLRLRKLPSLLARTFSLEHMDTLTDEEERLVLSSVMMMLMLERARK